jgi:hypothetical protein
MVLGTFAKVLIQGLESFLDLMHQEKNKQSMHNYVCLVRNVMHPQV